MLFDPVQYYLHACKESSIWQAALTGVAKTMALAVAIGEKLTDRPGLSVRIFGLYCGHSVVRQQPTSHSIQHDSSVTCQLMLKSRITSHACGNVRQCPRSCRGGVPCFTPESNLNN